MKLFKELSQQFGRVRFSLSTRFIMAMAGMVILTALASIVIFYIIITNQTRDLENGIQRAFVQFQDLRKQNQKPPEATIAQLKAILNDSTLTAEAQITQVGRTLGDSDGISPPMFINILRDAGLPVSPQQRTVRLNGPPPGPTGTNVYERRTKGPGVSAVAIAEETENRLFSPVIQSFALGSLVAALGAVLLGFFLSRTVIRPLRALEQASERIADGNYKLELGPEGKDDLGRLARSFNRMAHALSLTEQKRKELVADVAHELRTPLSSIQGYTEVLRDGLVASRDRQEQIYDHILKEVRQLSTMVESLRVWMSNEQALEHLSIEEIPARLPVELVLERFGQEAAHKEVSLELKVDDSRSEPQIRADSDALAHVLSNLVDNALRYTPFGGSVRLNVAAPAQLSGSTQRVVWFEVADNGSGIAPEHLPFVFERFYRVDKSRDRMTGGTGLGLAIVRDTVLALGGEVQIKSEVGSGTTIRFWLPAAQLPAPRKGSPLLVGAKAG